MTIDSIIQTGLAPFMNQVGWQGFAYGLLGLKTLRKVFAFVKERGTNLNTTNDDD